MRFTAALVAIGAVASAGLPKRDFVDVVNDFAQIQTQVNALHDAIRAYTNATPAGAIIGDLLAVIPTINQGIADADASAPFTTTQVVGLIAPVRGLTANVSTTVDDLIGQKSILVSTCQGAVIYESLLEQQSAASKLASAVTAKVPAGLQSTAQQLSSTITDAFARGVQAYSDARTPPASCASHTFNTSASPSVSSVSPVSSPSDPSHVGLTPHTGAAFRSQLSAVVVGAVVPLAFFL